MEVHEVKILVHTDIGRTTNKVPCDDQVCVMPEEARTLALGQWALGDHEWPMPHVDGATPPPPSPPAAVDGGVSSPADTIHVAPAAVLPPVPHMASAPASVSSGKPGW